MMLRVNENPTTDAVHGLPLYQYESKQFTEMVEDFSYQEVYEKQRLKKSSPEELSITGSENKSKINIDEVWKKIENIDTLNKISQLQDNWDSKGASAFKEDIIFKVRELIQNSLLMYQPDIFPTFRDSIQVEYEKNNGDYLEFEFFENQILMLKIVKDVETESTVYDIGDIVDIINRFMHEF